MVLTNTVLRPSFGRPAKFKPEQRKCADKVERMSGNLKQSDIYRIVNDHFLQSDEHSSTNFRWIGRFDSWPGRVIVEQKPARKPNRSVR